MRKIYAYTFPEHRKNINDSGRFLIKIGDTERCPVDRIKEQDTTSNASPPEILWISDEVEFRDYDVHKVIEELGAVRQRNNREWFLTYVEEIRRAVNKVKYGTERESSFTMRPEQKTAVDLAANYFSDKIEATFLWNAKMRFGKTFAALQLVKRVAPLRVLILTYKPATSYGWRKELENHVDFVGYNFVHALDYQDSEIRLSDRDILFASFQDILQDFEVDEERSEEQCGSIHVKKKFSNLFDEFFDLVIIDEVHFGATNTPAQQLLGKIQKSFVLYLSGTPFKILSRGELSDDQIFSWTYMDEQKCKKRLLSSNIPESDNPYFQMPKMNLLGYSLSPEVFRESTFYNDEEYFNFKKFFYSHDGKNFVHNQAVNNFVDLLSSQKPGASPFSSNQIKGEGLRHTLWILPGVKECEAFYHKLIGHHHFSNFEVICAAGNNLGMGADTLGVVRNAIRKVDEKRDKLGTITLSCGKLTAGVTVPEWNGIFLLTNTQSIELYFQSIFRVQSANKKTNKQNCYVFDFDSDRMIQMVYGYAKESCNDGKVEEAVKEILSTMNLLCYEGNSFGELSVSDIMEMAIRGVGGSMLVKKFESRYLLNATAIADIKNNDMLLEALERIKIFRKVSNKLEIEISEGSGKGKTFKTTLDEADKDPKLRDKILETIKQKLQRLLTRLPIFMYLSEYVEEHIDDVIEQLEPDLFEETTGITVADFKLLKEANAFDLTRLNAAIQAFKHYERDAILNSKVMKTDILDVMASLSNEEVFTPVKVVNDVLDMYPSHVWSDTSMRWFNPVEKNGVWLREVLRRLIGNGIEEQYALHNMLFAYTTSNIAYQMCCKTLYSEVINEGKHIVWREKAKKLNNIRNERFLDVKEMSAMPDFSEGAVIGNPPYQESDGGGGQGTSAKPLYNLFTEKIIDEIAPKYFSFIIPSRWFAGGKGLDSFRERMKNDKHIKIIRDFPNGKEIFSGVDIKGGVCYFLRDKNYNGPCNFNGWNNDLSKFEIILRDITNINIVNKIIFRQDFYPFSNRVLPRKPFSLGSNLRNDSKAKTPINCYIAGRKLIVIDAEKVYGNAGKFEDKNNLIGKWKVFSSKAQTPNHQKSPVVFAGKPDEICSESYLVLGYFTTKTEAENLIKYTYTHFFEFMLKLMVITQNISANKYSFVPDQMDYTKEYTDEFLYKKYGLTQEEIDFIESKFK